MKNNKNAISLIVLVITIIILAVLAAVVIVNLFEDDGLINTSKDAVMTNYEAMAKEDIATAWAEVMVQYTGSQGNGVSKEEFFSEERLNNYLPSKGRVLYSDGVEYTVYSSDTSKMTYLFRINEAGIVETIKKVETSKLKYGRAADIITPETYGNDVLYSANGVNNWKIFYNDSDNIFIITSDYLLSEKIPSQVPLPKRVGKYAVSWAHMDTGLAAITITIDTGVSSKFMLKGIELFSPSNNNYRAVATLLNTEYWSAFVNSNYAEAAIGSPTADMWVESWNDKFDDDVTLTHNNLGYKVSGGISSSDEYQTKVVDIATSNYEDIAVYFPWTTNKDNDGNTLSGYHLASPSACLNSKLAPGTYIMRINYDGRVYYNDYWQCNRALRPVVCIKDLNVYGFGDLWLLTNQ